MKLVHKVVRFMNSSEGSVKHKFLRSSLWLGLASIVLRFMELVRSVILARLLLPEVFGVMGIIHLLREGITQLSQTSFNQAIIYRKTKIEESVNTAWVLNIIRGFILFALMLFLSPLIASFYDEEFLNTGIKILGIVFIFEGLYNVNMVLYQKNIDLKKIAILNMTTNAVGIIVVIVLAYYLRNVWALLVGIIFTSIANVSLSYFITEKKPKFSFDSSLAWEMFHYAKYLTGAGIIYFLTKRLDDGLIGKLLGMRELGFYINAYFFANLPSTHIHSLLSPLIFPTYSYYNQDQEKLNQLFLRVFKVISTVSIPASFGVLALSDEIASVLLGKIWEPMVPALKILVFFGLFRALAGCTGPLLNAMGKPEITFWIMFGKLAMIAIIIYPLTVEYGIMGTAIAITIPMLLEQIYLWFVIKRLTSIKILTLLGVVIRPTLLAGVMYAFIMFLKTILPLTSIPLFFFYVLIGILVYGAGILIFDKELIKEIQSLRLEKKAVSNEK